MKKIVTFFILVIAFFAHQAFAESISSYRIDMQLKNDASVLVTETIEYNFDGQRHGIFRTIPTVFELDDEDKKRRIDISLVSVKRDGVSESYTETLKRMDNEFVIKVGDPNTTITGTHRYEIKYVVTGSLRYFDDYDEIYWNVIGDEWEIPIADINVSVLLANTAVINRACYVGESGSGNSCTYISDIEPNKLFFYQDNLGPGQGFTIAASFPKGVVPVVEYTNNQFSLYAILAGIGALVLGLFIFIRKKILAYAYKYKTYDPGHPRYEPPAGISALFTGYIVDKTFNDRDLTAGIIQLARDGYITIESITEKNFIGTSRDYVFRLKKTREEILATNNQPLIKIINLLFSGYNDGISGTPPNARISVDGFSMSIGSLQKMTHNKSSEDKTEFLTKQKMSDIPGSQGEIIKKEIAKSITDRAINQGYFEFKYNPERKWLTTLIIVTMILLIILPGFLKIILFVVEFLFFIIYNVITNKYLTRYTTKGWQVKHDIEGFKIFLEMTEKDRLDFHNAPEKNPEKFMEYLPYAIALGVEKKWAQQFEGMFIPEPDWYSGSQATSAMLIADSFSGFSRSMSSATTAPRSSSGSGGGGFSGGGAGGGGGGSW